MKILHVTAGIQETCGVSCFVMEIAKAQVAAGHDVCIVTTMTCGYPAGNLNVQLLDDPENIDFEPDIVHLHCIWNLYVHRMAVWCRKKNIPYVLSPHGALTPWALKFKWWKKIPAMLLYQYRDLKKAEAFHVTAQSEEEDISRLRLKQKVLTAPLGVYLPDHNDNKKKKIFLFLSRIHPKKGLENLLRAWSEISSELRGGWEIVIAGPDDIGHQEVLKNLAEELKLSVTDFSKDLQYGKKQIHGGGEVPAEVYREKLKESQGEIIFTGAVYSEAKQFFYQIAKYFVLPSFSENFGVVVVEALAAGTPVLTTTGTPWQILEEKECGLWVKPEVSALQNALEKFLTLPDEQFSIMSENSKNFVKENYLWEKSSEKLLSLYNEILNKQA
jgi:glycosyltransferase involved in cell wall biosynthesis